MVNKPDMLADLVNTSVCHPELHGFKIAVVYACQRQVILSPKADVEEVSWEMESNCSPRVGSYLEPAGSRQGCSDV